METLLQHHIVSWVIPYPGMYQLGHSIQILRNLKGIINYNELLIVCKTLVQHHIDYCITVWGNYNMNKLQMLQNKTVRILKGDFN